MKGKIEKLILEDGYNYWEAVWIAFRPHIVYVAVTTAAIYLAIKADHFLHMK